MTLRDHTATIALCSSLMLHGAISCYLLNRAAGEFGRQTHWAALPVPEGVVRSPIFVDEAVLSPPTPAPRPVVPPAAPIPPSAPSAPRPLGLPPEPALRPLAIPKPELAPDSGMAKPIPMDGFGELTGEADATALHSLSGDMPMQARKADQDQPLIRREPTMRSGDPDGAGGPAEPSVPARMEVAKPVAAVPSAPKPVSSPQPAKPAPSPAPASESAKIDTPELQQEPAGQNVAASLLVPGPESDRSKLGKDSSELSLSPVRPVEIASAQNMSQKRLPPDIPIAALNEAMAVSGAPAKTSHVPAGDVAPQSDSDSDAFTVTGSAEFRPGKVVARFGRAVKTVRPKLSLAGRNDLLSVTDPTVILEVKADETGTVRNVRITRSSGSNEVDQPCKLAMYQWWFEPPRDSTGRPRPSVMRWTIRFSVW